MYKFTTRIYLLVIDLRRVCKIDLIFIGKKLVVADFDILYAL